MGGKNATQKTARGAKAARSRARSNNSVTKKVVYRKAKSRHISGRSNMSKQQLENALH